MTAARVTLEIDVYPMGRRDWRASAGEPCSWGRAIEASGPTRAAALANLRADLAVIAANVHGRRYVYSVDGPVFVIYPVGADAAGEPTFGYDIVRAGSGRASSTYFGAASLDAAVEVATRHADQAFGGHV